MERRSWAIGGGCIVVVAALAVVFVVSGRMSAKAEKELMGLTSEFALAFDVRNLATITDNRLFERNEVRNALDKMNAFSADVFSRTGESASVRVLRQESDGSVKTVLTMTSLDDLDVGSTVDADSHLLESMKSGNEAAWRDYRGGSDVIVVCRPLERTGQTKLAVEVVYSAGAVVSNKKFLLQVPIVLTIAVCVVAWLVYTVHQRYHARFSSKKVPAKVQKAIAERRFQLHRKIDKAERLQRERFSRKIDRRRHCRIEGSATRLSYTIGASGLFGGQQLRAHVLDFSSWGLCFETRRSILPGTKLQLSLSFPMLYGTFRCKGFVRGVNRLKDDAERTIHLIHVEFLSRRPLEVLRLVNSSWCVFYRREKRRREGCIENQ